MQGRGSARLIFTSVAQAAQPQEQDVLHIPMGTRSVRMLAGLAVHGSPGSKYGSGNMPHPCEQAASPPPVGGPFHDTSYTYVFLLNGVPIAGGSGSLCSTPMYLGAAMLIDRTIDVTAVAATDDAEMRVIAITDGVGWEGYELWGMIGIRNPRGEVHYHVRESGIRPRTSICR
jgi:hypothetical protein